MMIKIACKKCGHVGIASATRLPHHFTCSQCGTSCSVEPDRTERIMSTERRMGRVNAIRAAR
jgi:hypothetical protein